MVLRCWLALARYWDDWANAPKTGSTAGRVGSACSFSPPTSCPELRHKTPSILPPSELGSLLRTATSIAAAWAMPGNAATTAR